MRTILIICFCLVAVCGICQSQLSFQVGYGTFALADIKSLQESQLLTYPVKAEITSSFPSYWIYGLSGKKFLRNNFMIGVSGVMGSTGSRIYYEDYSGSVGSDQLLRFTALGLHLGIFDRLKSQKVHFTVDLNPGVVFTSMKLRSFQALQGYAPSEVVTDVRSLNVALQPTFALTRRFGPLGLNVFAGYHVMIVQGKLKLKENKDAFLAVKADWSGLRVGVGAVLFLKRSASSLDQ